MNWISNVVRPRIRSFLTTKRDVPDNMWVKCPESGQMVFYKDLEANQFVVPGSNHHMRMGADDRLAHIFDDGKYETVALPEVAADPLKFRDGRRYVDRIKDARSSTTMQDAVLVGEGTLEGRKVVAAAQDFRFMGGSLGMAAGEAIITGMLRAVDLKTPFILFAASGGARMQEGILSLMQMPRTTIAVQRLRDNNLPYIVVLTDPTTGGVTASYAMLGDIHIAEPGALICFAGPRVIQQTIREQLPDGFQRAEYLLEHGMIDMVVHRHKMRETLARVVRLLANEQMSDKGIDAADGDTPGLLTTDVAEKGVPANGSGRASGTPGVQANGKANSANLADSTGTASRTNGAGKAGGLTGNSQKIPADEKAASARPAKADTAAAEKKNGAAGAGKA
ncbi:MAG TPA: acetyl-CoA carboxylase, carboxyltransferase subunit beta [Hyphomicrobiaceae bacterium]|nr:acetyl-CoA carboxylase, carboxyltransferase subunit beta [Hyphomicrobiaceae bacterium]